MPLQSDTYRETALKMIREGKSLFVTGKAGTGKTTLLRTIVEDAKTSKKNVAVLAPTGVAAMNAGGVTIHSFLKLPTSIYLPGMKVQGLYKLDFEGISVVRQLDMIIIDEISMVRCDLLDAIDDVLRHYRNNKKDFGGIQMVFMGDLYQLMPVAEDEDWEKLKGVYESSYFFSSKVFKQMKCPMLELKKVYRQTNSDFVDLLNDVRRGRVTPSEMEMLTKRYQKTAPEDVQTIRLTTHNYRARKYNQERLETLTTPIEEYKAYIEGYFPTEDYPTRYVLELRKGARVMFIRNDNLHRYVNGSLGTVCCVEEGYILVKLDTGNTISVERCLWEKLQYRVDKKTKTIVTSVLGTFKQYPLKLAWAVTIHKSQGLTFDKVVIDAGKAFTYGQVYVALSRCRTFSGITLVSPITPKIVKTDPIVDCFMRGIKSVVAEKTSPVRKKTEADNREDVLRLTRLMVKENFSLEEMAKQRNERIEIIYSHVATLIERGEANALDFIDRESYNTIVNVFRAKGINTLLMKVKNLSGLDIDFGKIQMIKAQLVRLGGDDPTVQTKEVRQREKEESWIKKARRILRK